MNNNRVKNLLFALVALLPMAYLAVNWNSIPETVPVHYNINGEPDRFGSKNELLVIAGLMAGAALLVYFLLRNIHKLDPKLRRSKKPTVFNKLAAAILIFITALNLLITVSAVEQDVRWLDRAMLPLLGLMFVFLGNYMYTVKPNYFAGFRTPWALSNDENWRKTHRLGGALWFVAGVLITLLSLLLPMAVATVAMLCILIPATLIPFVYSFMLFRRTVGKTADIGQETSGRT
ncbi:MAG TPA: SdpI family protein [Chitinophagales bacterium]|nr:SdpI family protein [Chitinophagales bacterium]